MPRLPGPLTFLVAVASCAVALAVPLGPAGRADADRAAPAGPRLAFIEVQFPKGDSDRAAVAGRSGGGEPEALPSNLLTVAADGTDQQVLLAGSERLAPAPLQAPSWSGDGREIAFAGYETKGKKTRGGIYLLASNGGGRRDVPGTSGAQDPILSPDGHWIAFSRDRGYRESTTWIIPAAGGKARRLTSWARGRFEDPSGFSPDGSRLLLSVTPTHGHEEVDSYDLATAKVETVEVRASHGVYSPDGSKIAFVSFRDHDTVRGFDEPELASELYVADADGPHPLRLTHTSGLEEQEPSWDPSGERIAYVRYPAGLLEFIGVKAVVAEVNADGTCPTVVARPQPENGHQAAIFAPSWQPGPGRGAGPIAC